MVVPTPARPTIISAYPCELPIISLGGSGSVNINGTYISFRGIATINGATGFGNKWTGGGTTNSNGNLEFINCSADMHSANGIAFRSAKGVHIKQSIVAHTGFSTSASWSSGVDLFGAQGTYKDNIVEQTIAFENMDNERHTDGSGFRDLGMFKEDFFIGMEAYLTQIQQQVPGTHEEFLERLKG